VTELPPAWPPAAPHVVREFVPGTDGATFPKSQGSLELRCAKPPAGYLVNREKRKVFPAGCMAWSCRKCARVLAYRVKKRLEPINWAAKVELTLDGDGEPTRANNRRLALGTRYLLQFVRRYFRRKYGEGWKLRYARMHGIGEVGGRLHSHLLWDAPYIDQEVLSEHAEACGLGFRVWIRQVSDGHGRGDEAATYVAGQAVSYVSQQALSAGEHRDLPRGARRFQSSGVPPYEPEEGWRWQELAPDFAGRDFPEGYDAELIAFVRSEGSGTKLPDGQILVGIEKSTLGFLDLSSLVLCGETASVQPAQRAAPLQLRWGMAAGFT
jgi:hypothetical protein